MGCGKNDLNRHTGFAIQTLAIGNWKVSNHENCQQKGVWASKIFWPDHLSTSSKTRMTQWSGKETENFFSWQMESSAALEKTFCGGGRRGCLSKLKFLYNISILIDWYWLCCCLYCCLQLCTSQYVLLYL